MLARRRLAVILKGFLTVRKPPARKVDGQRADTSVPDAGNGRKNNVRPFTAANGRLAMPSKKTSNRLPIWSRNAFLSVAEIKAEIVLMQYD